MNGVEAAASLFGSDDAGSDPFASLGDGTASADEAPNNHNGPHSGFSQHQVSTSGDIFDGVQPTPSAEDTSQYHMPVQYAASHSSGQHIPYSSPGGAKEYHHQDWHSPGQPQTSGAQVNTSPWSAYSPSSENSRLPPQHSHNPYVASSVVNSYTGSYVAPSGGAEYSPYNPSMSSVVSKTHQHTSAYAPPSSTTYATAGSLSYNAHVPLSSTVNVPQPPAPMSTINRPKVSNAYDPPFPSTIKSKRASSRPGAGQNLTAGYNPQSTAYNSSPMHYPHQPPVPPQIPISRSPPSAIQQRRHGDHLDDTGYLTSSLVLGRGSVDGLPRQDAAYPTYPSQSHTQYNSTDGYETEARMVESIRKSEHVNQITEDKPLHHSTNKQRNASPTSSFTSNIPWQPEAGLDDPTHVQFHSKESCHESPSRASIHPDSIARTFSPDRPVSAASEGTQAHVPSAGSGPSLALSGVPFSSTPTRPPVSTGHFGPLNGNRYVNTIDERRAASPVSQSARSLNGRQSTKPQPGVRPPSRVEALRGRSLSNGSVLNSAQSGESCGYSPSNRQQLESGSVHHTPISLVDQPGYPTFDRPANVHDLYSKTQAPYAPSPSLLGTNDPLGRTSARAPVFSFGFGGKFVTCYHGSKTLNTGFDVALSSRRTTTVQIHVLSRIIPRSALDIPVTSFPGPLFLDPEVSTSSLVRTTASGQRNKKAGVIKYLVERVEEISHGLGYLSQESSERRHAEGKLILVKLLKSMVENDGRFSGSPAAEASVRAALVPRLDGTLASPTPEFTTIADSHAIYSDLGSMDRDSVITVSTLRSSSLDRIQDFLLRGERRQAYHYALDEKLWAHAMVIASSIDKDAWKEVITEFLRAELGVKDEHLHGTSYPTTKNLVSPTNGREALRVAYSLYSGQGAASIQELVPQTSLSRGSTRLQVQNVTPAHITPRTPNFHIPAPLNNVPPETMAKWAEIVAMMISSSINADTSSALTALGDQLLANQYVEAAHVCYLLAPQTSLIGGLGNPAVRIVLVGSKTPAVVPNFAADQEPMIFSEIVEFALSLSPVAKGQEPFAGLPHFQAYKFIRAISLAEMGEIQLANRYCDAISASLGRSSPYFTSALLDQLRGLMDRISGTSHVDKSSSWMGMGSKIGKPSLDSIGGWLEGRIAQFVAGDADSATHAQERTSLEEQTFSGPFSTISSTTPSARSSPQPMPATISLARSGSAMAISSHNPNVPVDRASSAMDYYKPKSASAPRVVSAGPAISTFSQLQSQRLGLHDQSQIKSDSSTDDTSTPKATNNDNGQEPAWWGGSVSYSYNENTSAKTPTATSFMHVEESALRSTPDGFISLMDAPTFSGGALKATHDLPRPPTLPEEDVEDLGLGNSKRERNVSKDDNTCNSAQPEPQKPAEPERTAPDSPSQPGGAGGSGGSWFSRWWKRDAAPGPVRASLGEENAFYYDKDLKRWVNKKAGIDNSATKPVPPPPPSRAQTASPSMASARPTVPSPPSTQTNPTSSIDLTASPPSKSMLRVRSNLAPPVSETAPSTPTGTRTVPGAPPPGRPRSQASTKRNLRSRYVDVLQPEGSTS